MTEAGQIVFDKILKDHNGEFGPALADLSERFARIALQLHRADRLRSFAYAREVPQRSGQIDDVPNPVDDEWIRTGADGAKV